MASQTLTIRKPDDWHVHLRDGEMLRRVAPFHGAAVRAGDRDAQSGAADHHRRRRRRLSRTDHRSRRARLHAADDLLSDRRSRPRRNRARLRGRRVGRRQALSGRRDHQQRQRRDRHPQHLSGARADGADRHGAMRPRRGDRPGRRRVRPRSGVHRSRAVAPRRATFRGSGSCSSISRRQKPSQFVTEQRPEHRARPSRRSTCIINRNAIFAGGLRPHAYCLPVAKREQHRLAVRKAATSGSPKFFLGTDSAPHAREAKETACGCAGIFNAPFALESYATVFEEDGALDQLRGVRLLTRGALLRTAGERGHDHAANGRDVPCRRRVDGLVPFHAGERCAGGSPPRARAPPRPPVPITAPKCSSRLLVAFACAALEPGAVGDPDGASAGRDQPFV